MNLSFLLDDQFRFFILREDGERIPVIDWNQFHSEFLAQLSILFELRDNGYASITEYTIQVEIIDILKLPELNRLILGLPTQYPYEVYVQSDGQLNQESFNFVYGFYDFAPNGTRLLADRQGPIIRINDIDYLLSESTFLLCEAIDSFNKLPSSARCFNKNLRSFAEIKALSKSEALVLDSYLNSQEVVYPEKIKIDLNFSNGVLEVRPTIGVENESGFIKAFDKFPRILESYPISSENSKTTRVVFSENQKDELRRLKTNRYVEDSEKINDLIENPEKYFNEDYVDFTVFYGERVKEIGLYKPKFYPFVCPYKSEWIPGLSIKDRLEGEKRIYLKTPENLLEFIEKRDEAISMGKQSVLWENVEIPLNKAENFIETAKAQFQDSKIPVDKKSLKVDSEVLIIKENAEQTEFVQSVAVPESIDHNFIEISNLRSNVVLKQHQVEGISWLQTLNRENLSGCLLADDMGLGKTLQLLYFIEWHSQFSNFNKPYLIVAPVSLLENWESEYKKFFFPNNLPLTILSSTAKLTKEFSLDHNQREAKELQRSHIILTNYETVRSYQATLCLVDFALVALDEAQKIKTPGTLVTNAIKALKSDFKVAMTGTPVENTLIDIWCIIDFAVPGLLGNAKDFAKEFQNPLKDENSDLKELTEKLRGKIGIFIKRRLKRDVAKDLPAKHDNEGSRMCRIMPVAQLEKYKIQINDANDIDLIGVEVRNKKLRALWAIRDISDHPYLIDSQILDFSSEQLISTSAKLQVTVEILDHIKQKGEKAILFADRKETQKMLQKIVYERFDVLASIVNGDTPNTKQKDDTARMSRQQSIDRFQGKEGFNVIIMSPLAAGVGLNVTGANHVIHYSRHWNPAKEDQSTDRAYRIGQKKEVFVYYPMAVFPDSMVDQNGKKLKSFDEILNELLENKKKLASSTLFPTEQAEVRPDELFGNVFGFNADPQVEVLTMSQLDRLNPNLFEAAVGALYESMGFKVHLTPYSNDKGVDVVVIGKGEGYLLQVKQSKALIGKDAVQEVYTAKRYYETKYNMSFNLKVVTNSNYSSTAELLGQSNQVQLIDRSRLLELLSQYKVSLRGLNKLESQRLTRI